MFIFLCAILFFSSSDVNCRSYFDEEEVSKIGNSGLYGSRTPKLEFSNYLDESSLNWTAYGVPGSPSYVDVGLSADKDVIEMVSGKENQEPIYGTKVNPQDKRRWARSTDHRSNLLEVLLATAPQKKQNFDQHRHGRMHRQKYSSTRRLKKRDLDNEESKEKIRLVAQDYYGAIRNTREQKHGRSLSSRVATFKKLVNIPSFQESMAVLMENLAESKRFREALMILFEKMIADVSITKKMNEKLQKLEEKERENAATEEEEELEDEVSKTGRKKKSRKSPKRTLDVINIPNPSHSKSNDKLPPIESEIMEDKRLNHKNKNKEKRDRTD